MQKDEVELRILRATNEIIGIVGDLRAIVASPRIDEADRKYFELEIDRLQATAHRIAAFAEHVEMPKH